MMHLHYVPNRTEMIDWQNKQGNNESIDELQYVICKQGFLPSFNI